MWKKVLVSAIIIGAVLIGIGWFLNNQFGGQSPQEGPTEVEAGARKLAGWLFNVSTPSGNRLYFILDYDLTMGYQGYGGYAVYTESEVKAKTNLTNIYPVIRKPQSTKEDVEKAVIRASAKYFANESLKIGTPIIKYRNIRHDVRPWMWDIPVYRDSSEGFAVYHMGDGDEEVMGMGELYSTHEYLNWYVEEMKDDKKARQFLLTWLEERNIDAKIIESFFISFAIGQKVGP